jgi:polysaccharide biosynthesis protein PslH
MRVLYATVRPPAPQGMGDQLIAYEQLARLGADDEIHLLSLDDGRHDRAQLEAMLAPHCRSIHLLPYRPRRRRAWRSLYNGLPVLVNLFYTPALRARLESIVRAVAPDLLHVQTVHLTEHFNHLEIPKVLDLIDAMSLNMMRRASRERGLRHVVYRREAAMLKRYERRTMARYQAVSLVSAADAAYLAESRITVNPNGTYITPALLASYPAARRECALLFHGNMDYFANVDAVRWFGTTVWPVLAGRYPALKWYIAGRNPARRVRALHDGERVIVTGEVTDMLRYLTTCLVAVCPLQTGVGLQNKILEAFAAGLPAVASPFAIQGIPDAREDEHLLVARDPADWVAQVSRLVDDAVLRDEYARRAQQLVFARYSWTRNAATLRRLWCDAVRRPHGVQ